MISSELLQSFSHTLNSNTRTEISKVSQLKTFFKNDIIIDINQNLIAVPLLVKGHIKVLREDKNGEELLLYVLKSGDACAMSLTCCLSNSKSKVRAVAENDTEVVMIPLNYMKEWFNTNENWRNFILQSYQIRFNEMLETIDTLAFLKLDERLLKYLNDKVKLDASFTVNITHQEIAEDLHTSRVVISRLLKQLEKEKKISLARNQITILNI